MVFLLEHIRPLAITFRGLNELMLGKPQVSPLTATTRGLLLCLCVLLRGRVPMRAQMVAIMQLQEHIQASEN